MLDVIIFLNVVLDLLIQLREDLIVGVLQVEDAAVVAAQQVARVLVRARPVVRLDPHAKYFGVKKGAS